MKSTTFKIPFRVVLIAGSFLYILMAAHGQENWNSGNGASTWQAGSAVNKMPAPQMNSSGSANWTPEKQGFGSGSQPGGVWHAAVPGGGSGFSRAANPTSTGQQPGRIGAAGGYRPGLLLSPMPVLTQGKQSYRPSAGLHASPGSHSGVRHGAHSSGIRTSRTRPTGFGSSGISGSSGSNRSSSLGSTTNNSMGLQTQPSPTLLPEFPNF